MVGTYSNSCGQSIVHRTSDLNVNAAIPTTFQLAGFVNTRYCTLVNTSLIPMTFKLRVPADGWANEEMHSHDNSLLDSNLSDVGSTIMSSPREFDISPSTGTIAPQGELDIKVTRMFFEKYIMLHGLSFGKYK